jgi:hypothetical protein
MLIVKQDKTNMDQEQQHVESEQTTLSMDDTSVLRVLLHTIAGIKPVAGSPLDIFSIEDEVSDV